MVLMIAVMLGVVMPAWAGAEVSAGGGAGGGGEAGGAGVQGLVEGFDDPPKEARTRCFWWWLNGNVTKEAITRDIEEMKAKGFGGAMIFDADGSSQRGNSSAPVGPMFGSPAWRELLLHAVNEARRVDFELGLSIQSGWNLGGPDVTAEEAAKQLTSATVRVQGPGPMTQPLPVPKARSKFYRDIALLAYRVPDEAGGGMVQASSQQVEHSANQAVDGDAATSWVSEKWETKPNRHAWIEWVGEESRMISGVRITGRPGYGPKRLRIEVRDGPVRTLGGERTMADGKPLEVRFDAVKTARLRLVVLDAFDSKFPTEPRNVQIAEFQLLDEKGGPIGPSSPGISQLDLKSMYHELGGSAPDCRPLLFDDEPKPGEPTVDPKSMVDLTDKLAADGRLVWDVPPGRWEVLRVGYTLTEAKVSTSSGPWQGLVLDYLNQDTLNAYLERHITPLIQMIGSHAGTTLKHLQTDSWECGGMNWTPSMEAHFKRLRGYDIRPWLPVFAGRIVGDRDQSNRFLADFRKTLGQLVAEQHYAVFAAYARRYNMGIHPESGGPHAGPIDAIRTLGHSEIPMAEFWRPSPHRPTPDRRFFVKQASSAAHVYGKTRVAAEGFTSIGPHWDDSWWQHLKPSFDTEACAGLNLTFIHTVTCSPPEMGLPGQEYFAGTHFNPQVTWWPQAGSFVGYLNRCHFLLQQGRPISDVVYYYGDHVPNIARLKADDPAGALPDYDYDVIDEHALITRLSVAPDGRLVLPDGVSYRLLALPDHRILSHESLAHIDHLVRSGATVLGHRPLRTASLTGLPASEQKFLQTVSQLWGEGDSGQRTVGKGQVIWGKTARQALADMGAPPDVRIEGSDTTGIDWIHRQTPHADIYFIANTTDQPRSVTLSFRVAGRQPQLWDPLTARRRNAPAFKQVAGRTVIPLNLAPCQSTFILFTSPIPPGHHGTHASNEPTISRHIDITGPWQVHFDPARQGPGKLTFNTLTDWTKHPDPAVRFYSGSATYHQQINLPPDALTGRVILELGNVLELAQVTINTQPAGVAWVPPFHLDVTHLLKPGPNDLQILVVNTWRNRLVGDRDLPPNQRSTRTNITIKKDWTPLPSGLLGPVRLLITNP